MTNQKAPVNPKLYSIESEQAVLGAILFENAAYDEIGHFLKPEHFYDPVHGLIFEMICKLILEGKVANPVLINAAMSQEPAYAAINGQQYLVKLTTMAVGTIGVADYARLILDTYRLRKVHAAAETIIGDVAKSDPINDDPSTIAERAEDALHAAFAASDESSGPKMAGEAFDEWQEAIKARGQEPPGHLTGLEDLDEVTGGLRAGKLYIVAGRPSMGKSTVLVHLSRRMAEKGGIAFASGEMDATELPVIMATDVMRDTGIKLPYLQAEKDLMTDEERERFAACRDYVSKLPIYIDDTPAPTLGHIRRFCFKASNKFKKINMPFRALMVDYLQILERNPNLRGTEAIAELCKGLISIGKQFNVPVVVGCQINRNAESRDDRRPQLTDLRESGDIENEAFAVFLLFREEYYHALNEPPEGDKNRSDWLDTKDRLRTEKPLEIIVAKNRRGPKTTVKTWCEVETGAIRHRSYCATDPRDYQKGLGI